MRVKVRVRVKVRARVRVSGSSPGLLLAVVGLAVLREEHDALLVGEHVAEPAW